MKTKTKSRRDWQEMVRIERDHPGLAGDARWANAMGKGKKRNWLRLLRGTSLVEKAAEKLVMPLLRPEEITYQDLWTMFDGLWALRSALHPHSAPGFVGDVPDERGTAARSGSAGIADTAFVRTLTRIKRMTKKQGVQSLKDAGILSPKGNYTKPYRKGAGGGDK
jgi:hypothetical protein